MISENNMNKEVSNEANRILDFPFFDGRPEPSGLPRDPVIEAMASLDDRCDDWSSSVATARLVDGFAIVTVRIIACGVSREGIGYSESFSGEGFVAAERQAFCDAASRFAETHRERGEGTFRAEAASIGNLISYRQLREIKALAAEKGVDGDEEAERIFGVSVSELSRAAASRLIVLIREREFRLKRSVKLAG